MKNPRISDRNPWILVYMETYLFDGYMLHEDTLLYLFDGYALNDDAWVERSDGDTVLAN